MDEKLSEILVEKNIINKEIADRALELQKETKQKLGECIINVLEKEINEAVPQTLGSRSTRCGCVS